MVSVGAGIMLVGYTLLWWGRETVRGCTVGIADLLIPGRYQGCSPPGSSKPGLVPAPQSTKTPPSTEGAMARVPTADFKPNVPTPVAPGWVNPFGNPRNDIKR